jgi:hypothetical protein
LLIKQTRLSRFAAIELKRKYMNKYCRDFSTMERIINWNEYTLKESKQTSNNGGNIRSHLKGGGGGGSGSITLW